jgi:hypothetical protein
MKSLKLKLFVQHSPLGVDYDSPVFDDGVLESSRSFIPFVSRDFFGSDLEVGCCYEVSVEFFYPYDDKFLSVVVLNNIIFEYESEDSFKGFYYFLYDDAVSRYDLLSAVYIKVISDGKAIISLSVVSSSILNNLTSKFLLNYVIIQDMNGLVLP